MMRWLMICSMLVSLTAGCDQRTPGQRLADFIADPRNKIRQSIKVGDVQVVARWMPHNYVLRAEVSAAGTDQADYSHYYFNVQFKRKDNLKAEGKIMYLNFDMQQDFTLLCEGDSISPAICQKIENGIAGSYEYMLAFENTNGRLGKKDFSLIYQDKIFGIGLIAFVFRNKDMRKVPGL